MSQLEIIDDKKAKLIFEIDSASFEASIKYVYNRDKGKINIHGFRKGKVPRQIIENMYGKDFFYHDAINHVLPEFYLKALEESEADVVSMPEFNVEEITEDKTVKMSAVVLLRPKAKIENYKGVEYFEYSIKVTDEDVTAEIDKAREQNARLVSVDRPIENGDIVTIDFEGSIDGEKFDGGTASDYELTIGSHSFIDTFEEQLIGKNINDEVEVHVTFPEDYAHESLRGKPAVFKVNVKKINFKDLPQADDDFAQDVSEFDTFDEYKNDIREKLEEKNKMDAQRDKENQVLEKLLENVEVEIPEVMIKDNAESMVRQMEDNITSQHLSFETYLQYMGQTRESLLKMYLPSAERQIKIRLMLEAVAANENLEVSDEDYNEELNKIAEMSKLDIEKVKELVDKSNAKKIKDDILVQKALDLLLDSAVEKKNE